MGCRGRDEAYCGMCRGGTRGRRPGDQGGLRRSKHGKREGKEDTRGQRGVSRDWPVCSWGHALCLIGAVRPVFSLDSISVSQARSPDPYVCGGAGDGCGRGPWVRVPVSIVAATGASAGACAGVRSPANVQPNQMESGVSGPGLGCRCF